MSKIIIASGPVIVENGKVLLNKSGEDNFWKFCGGRPREEESNLQVTAKRRVREEMGLEIEFLDEEPYFIHVEKEKEGQVTSIILVHFLAKRLNEVSPGEEVKEWAWLDLKNLPKEDLAPNILPTLKHFAFLE